MPSSSIDSKTRVFCVYYKGFTALGQVVLHKINLVEETAA